MVETRLIASLQDENENNKKCEKSQKDNSFNSMTLWTGTNYKQFKSNLVLRCECKPGSLLFLVCSQEKTGNNSNGEFSFKENLKDMFNLIAFDVVLLKLSYRFVK